MGDVVDDGGAEGAGREVALPDVEAGGEVVEDLAVHGRVAEERGLELVDGDGIGEGGAHRVFISWRMWRERTLSGRGWVWRIWTEAWRSLRLVTWASL